MGNLMNTEGEQYWEMRPLNDERKDWRNGGENWVEEYVRSKDHPHRQLIVNALKHFKPFESVFEIGCNAGPNLARIHELYPNVRLAGIDASYHAARYADDLVPTAEIRVGSMYELPFDNKEFDVGLTDAVLLYADPKEALKALTELKRVTRLGLILVEWFSETDEVKDHHWARNYPEILKRFGYEMVEERRLTEADWPTKKWQEHGRLFVFQVPSKTSKKNS